MRNIIVVVLLIIGVCCAGVYDSTYTLQDCVVTEVCNNSALIQDSNGHLWECHNVDITEGQIVDLVMYHNNTMTYVKDDIVKDVRAVN